MEVSLETGTAFLAGLGTPRGFILPVKVVELMPLMESHPRVSQYRPISGSVFEHGIHGEIMYLPDSNAVEASS